MDPAWITALTALAVAVIGFAAWAGRYAWQVMRRTTRFLDDYFGDPGHDGLAAKPGVMARLQSVEELVTKVAAELSRVAVETMPNDGTSIHDVVARIELALSKAETEQASMRARMEQLETQRVGREDAPAGT